MRSGTEEETFQEVEDARSQQEMDWVFEGHLRVKCAQNVTPGKKGWVSMGDIKIMSGWFWLHWSGSQSALSICDPKITSKGSLLHEASPTN